MARLTVEDYRKFVASLIQPLSPKSIVSIGELPEMSDCVAHITDTGNGANSVQNIFETRRFSITSRWTPHNLRDSADFANLIYSKLHVIENFDITEDIYCLYSKNVQKPRQMTYQDLDGRFLFVAEYEVKASQD